MSVFAWQNSLFKFQLAAQIGFALIIGGIAWRHFNKLSANREHQVVSLAEDGYWMALDPQSDQIWRLGAESKVSALLLWLKLHATSGDTDSSWRLLFKDQVSEQDYRRLCRIVYRQQKQLQQ